MIRHPNEQKIQHGIGFRLSVYSAALSLLFSALAVAILFYTEYQFQKKQIDTDIKQVVATVEQQLAKDLWNVDTDGLKVDIAALSNLPYIEGVKIVNYSEGNFLAGSFDKPIALNKTIRYEDEELATLQISYDLSYALDTVYKKYRTISLILLLTVCAMGLIFYLVYDKSLMRHIRYIALSKSHGEFNEIPEFKPLKLQREPRDDELNYLVSVLNKSKMQALELIQARKERQNQIEYQANFDLLTGLANRHKIYQHLDEEMRHYSHEKGWLLLLFIDIDGFKQVNDSLGHSVGDGMLKVCAERINAVSKNLGAFAGRLGGDEFILTFYRDDKGAYRMAAREIIESFEEKISHEGISVKLGCSIGISAFPNKDLRSPNELIQSADVALYQSKSAGRNTFMLFNNDMLEDMLLEKSIKNRLVEAVNEAAFEIYYQPLVELHDGNIVGFEALLRWHDKDLGWISPEIFIAIAEKTGLIFDIDLWVFEQACKQVQQWRQQFGQNFIASINFSPTGFYHSDFANWLNNSPQLNSTNNLDWIELEITERLILNDDPLVLSGIDSLRDKGIKFNIDDFGVGHSSLGYLKMFSHRLSKIKIDRIFINGLGNGQFDMAFIKSIMMLAKSLDLDVLAEGVEQEQQAKLLRETGCRYAQGYHYSSPLPASEIEDMLNLDAQQLLPAAGKGK